MVKDLQQRLMERKLSIELTEGAKTWLAETGYDSIYGARPLRRAIERYLENPLSTKLLQGDFKDGDTITIGHNKDGLTFNTKSGKKIK